MPQYEVIKELTYEGKDYKVGDTIELNATDAESLVVEGSIKLVGDQGEATQDQGQDSADQAADGEAGEDKAADEEAGQDNEQAA